MNLKYLIEINYWQIRNIEIWKCFMTVTCKIIFQVWLYQYVVQRGFLVNHLILLLIIMLSFGAYKSGFTNFFQETL